MTTTKEQKPASNAQRAVQQLRELIFSGELPAGSDHLETELAERLSMSRTPVREAALLLESQGLVEMRPRKGVRIVSVSPEDMREIYDVLTELESLAVERAAEAGYSEPQLSALDDAIRDMDQAIKAEDLEAWAKADDQFHAELMRLCGNSRLRMIVAMMSDQVRRAKALTLFIRPLPVQSNEDHRQVYAAILAGDPAKARRVHREHRRHARDVLTGILERMRLRNV